MTMCYIWSIFNVIPLAHNKYIKLKVFGMDLEAQKGHQIKWYHITRFTLPKPQKLSVKFLHSKIKNIFKPIVLPANKTLKPNITW